MLQMKVQFTALLCLLHVKKGKKLQKKATFKITDQLLIIFFVASVALILDIALYLKVLQKKLLSIEFHTKKSVNALVYFP